jgi:hypothetical protein
MIAQDEIEMRRRGVQIEMSKSQTQKVSFECEVSTEVARQLCAQIGALSKSRPCRRSNWVYIEVYLRSSTHDFRFSGYKDVVVERLSLVEDVENRDGFCEISMVGSLAPS